MNTETLSTEMDLANNRKTLSGLLFAADCLMGIAASVLVRTTSLEEKLVLSREIWALGQAVQLIGQRISRMRTADVRPRAANARYVHFTNRIVSLQNPVLEKAALVHIGYPEFLESVLTHRSRLLAQADEETVSCLTDVVHRIDTLRGASGPMPHCLQPLREVLLNGGRCIELSADEPPGAARPLRAVPVRPGRCATWQEGEPVPPTGPDRYGILLHDLAFRIELCAAEACAVVLAHDIDAPWELRHDMAKQVRDEARHFELFIERVREFGIAPGDLPIQFEVWDNFAMGRTLAERLIIEQRIGEGAALDSVEKVHSQMKRDGEDRIAVVFEYITADEVTHVANGNRWLRHLLGTEEAVAQAEAEVLRLLAATGHGPAFKHPINEADRVLSGFSDTELARLKKLHDESDHASREGASDTGGASSSCRAG